MRTEVFSIELSGESSSFLDYVNIIWRTKALFIATALIVLAIGATAITMVPQVYISEGKLIFPSKFPALVEGVASQGPEERLIGIKQRLLTRAKYLEIADKFGLFPGTPLGGNNVLDWFRSVGAPPGGRGIPSDIRVRLVRNAIRIEPVEETRRHAGAFTVLVSVDYSDPVTAKDVADFVIASIIEEDTRIRTSGTAGMIEFMMQDMVRLSDQSRSNDDKISSIKKEHKAAIPPTAVMKERLLKLRADLEEKKLSLSAEHPTVVALRHEIDGLDRQLSNPVSAELSALEERSVSLRAALEDATQKLARYQLSAKIASDMKNDKVELIDPPVQAQFASKPDRRLLLIMVLGVAGACATGASLLWDRMRTRKFRKGEGVRP